jgi:hypothetical protein
MSKAKKKTKAKKPAKASKKRKSVMRGMETMMRDVMNAVGGSMSFRHAAR